MELVTACQIFDRLIAVVGRVLYGDERGASDCLPGWSATAALAMAWRRWSLSVQLHHRDAIGETRVVM